jgi:hypothetical protein
MAKFHGIVGYVYNNVETNLGVWEDSVIERQYYGDVIRDVINTIDGNKVNDDIELKNKVSILADPYAMTNVYAIRYVKWKGTSWSVKNAEINRPRIILTLGGRYNENET